MFVIEYRTVSRLYAGIHASNFLTLGSHKATSKEQAAAVASKRLGPNVEILSISYERCGD